MSKTQKKEEREQGNTNKFKERLPSHKESTTHVDRPK